MLDFCAMQAAAAGGALPQLDPLRCLVTLSLALLPITMTKHYASERDQNAKEGNMHGEELERGDTEVGGGGRAREQTEDASD